jgi:hypothetical protein
LKYKTLLRKVQGLFKGDLPFEQGLENLGRIRQQANHDRHFQGSRGEPFRDAES